jgi:Tfp pilus assembly protein PilO
MNRRTVFLGGFAAIGVIALWWVFLFSPLGADLDDSRDELDDVRRDGIELNAELGQLRDLAARGPEIAAQLDELAAAIPNDAEQAAVVAGLNQLAQDAGITWQSVTMQEPTAAAPGQPPTIPLQIAIQGGYAQVVDYLDRLEELERLVVVDGVTVNGGGEGGSEGGSAGGLTASTELSISLNARIFSQRTLDSAAPTTTEGSGAGGGGAAAGSSDEVLN